MGNIIGKNRSNERKSKKHGKHRKRPDHKHRNGHGLGHTHRKNHHHHHQHHCHGNRDEHTPSRWSGYPSDNWEHSHARHHFNANDHHYFHGPSRHFYHDQSKHGMSTVAEHRIPSSSGSYVSSHRHNVTSHPHKHSCTCHARFDFSRHAPMSSVPTCCGTGRPISGSHLHYKSARPSRRVPSSIPASGFNDSSRKRGMVVYKIGKEEKLKMIDDDVEVHSTRKRSSFEEANETVARECTFSKRGSQDDSLDDRSSAKSCETKKSNPKSDPVSTTHHHHSHHTANHSKIDEEPSVKSQKKTIMNKFWQSPLGKKLPIGGPLAWFRSHHLQPLSEGKAGSIGPNAVVVRHKPRNLWSGLKRRFLWKSVSKTRRPSSSRPDGQEADVQVKVIPPTASSCDLRSASRHAPSRQYVWKTLSTQHDLVENNEVEVMELPLQKVPGSPSPISLDHNDDVFEDEILAKVTKRPNSPFFSSRYIWRSANKKTSKQAWNRTSGDHRKIESETKHKSPRSYLWKSNNVQPLDGIVQSSWMSESVLYHP